MTSFVDTYEKDMAKQALLSFNCSVDKITQVLAKSKCINHKGVKDTLYYYNDMIVCCAFAMRSTATKLSESVLLHIFFSRTNSTPINDNNGVCCC